MIMVTALVQVCSGGHAFRPGIGDMCGRVRPVYRLSVSTVFTVFGLRPDNLFCRSIRFWPGAAGRSVAHRLRLPLQAVGGIDLLTGRIRPRDFDTKKKKGGGGEKA